jgi:hypothetical protein
VFEYLCDREDATPSQVIRRMIRDYIEQRAGKPWQPGQRPEDLALQGDGKRAKAR